jgi:hypothetical protein
VQAAAVLGLLLAHVALLAWGATRHSPSNDEVAHLTAGLSYWRLARFDLYRVNPPLVRLVAGAPVALASPATDWQSISDGPRPEWRVGSAFLAANGAGSFRYFVLARWACVPLSLLGGLVCFFWARELYGAGAGLLALALWCVCPNVLGNGQTITTDVGAAAFGAAAGYCFWRWLRRPTWLRAFAAGAALGLAELTKTTWVVLFALWPALWLFWRWRRPAPAAQLALLLALAVYLLNLGYLFEGSGRRLGDFKFFSAALRGAEEVAPGGEPRLNRFADTWAAALPVPLPVNYVLGIDLQKVDFEVGSYSYLRGEWRHGGWWYYYLYALAVKVPLGTLLLLLLGLYVRARGDGAGPLWRDEVVVLAPAAAVLALVSSQSGLNDNLRYALPALPFAFVWAGRAARAFAARRWALAGLVAAAVAWSAGSSLRVYPHSLSYFNELAGGPENGHAHLLGQNIDLGQDLFYLKRWQDEHPEAHPLWLPYGGVFGPGLAGLYDGPPPDGLPPGWYALSVNRLRGRRGEYAGFLGLRPVGRAGYSIYVYHLSAAEADRLRRQGRPPEAATP